MIETDELRAQLRTLQIELVEAAVRFDRCRQPDAADLAMATANRLGELCEAAEAPLVRNEAQ